MEESVQEETIGNLLADILAEHSNARELGEYFRTIVSLSKSSRLDVYEDGWGYGFFDLPGDKEKEDYEEPLTVDQVLETACFCGECR